MVGTVELAAVEGEEQGRCAAAHAEVPGGVDDVYVTQDAHDVVGSDDEPPPSTSLERPS